MDIKSAFLNGMLDEEIYIVRRGLVLLYDLYFGRLATRQSFRTQVKSGSSGGSQDKRKGLKSGLKRIGSTGPGY